MLTSRNVFVVRWLNSIISILSNCTLTSYLFFCRERHENTSCLLCPFCLAIHHTTNSYLAHVIQHMVTISKSFNSFQLFCFESIFTIILHHQKKSVRCASCRLQFFTTFDKQAHVRSDHKSVMNATDKRKLPKNIAEYSVSCAVLL